MNSPEQALCKRIQELRRRHFGRQGKAAFAQRLGLTVEQYTRFERGTVPPGDVMVRICEATGEDLQWLLTGVAARGTVVISGTRGRHQDLLARLARLLDDRPETAPPVEAFVDLLARGARARAEPALELPRVKPTHLIPIFELDDLPRELPGSDSGPEGFFELAPIANAALERDVSAAVLAEPAMEYTAETEHSTELVVARGPDGRARDCLLSEELARCFPHAFGVRIPDDAMAPMFVTGDVALVVSGGAPRIGRPALCRLADGPAACCRIWLGENEGTVQLGRVGDGETEEITRDRLLWSLEVLFRVRRAA